MSSFTETKTRLSPSSVFSINEARLDEAFAEVRRDLEAGRTRSVRHYEGLYPEVAEELRDLIPSIVALERVRAKQMDDFAQIKAPPRIGDYEIVSEIGRGGMAVVYEARDPDLGRTVALKVLPFSSSLHETSVLRFQHEAQMLAQLDHPNIVPIYGVGENEGSRFLAMKLIRGCPLDEIVTIQDSRSQSEEHDSASINGLASTLVAGLPLLTRSAAQPTSSQSKTFHKIEKLVPQSRSEYLRFIAELGVEAATALHAAHQCGVVHRDIKPSNLMLDEDRHVWVTDFGLAFTHQDEKVTRTGDLLGTVRYMSPEQARGDRAMIGPRSDVYSLGVTLYELATCKAAFDGTAVDILHRIESEDLVPPRRSEPDFPRDLQNIILKATEKSADQRYQTAAELADDLNRFLAGEATMARQPTWLEQAVRWTSRRRRTVAVMLVFAGMLLAGSLVTTAMVYNEMTRTEAFRQEAEQNLLETQAVVDRFGLQLDRELALIDGTEHLRKLVLKDVITHYRGFIDRTKEASGLTENLAITLNKVALLTERIGTAEEALEAHAEAWRAFDKLVAANPAELDWKAQLALCDSSIGLLYANSGNFMAAEERYDAAEATLRWLLHNDGKNQQYQRDLSLTLNNIGLMYVNKRDSENAIRRFSEAQDMLSAIIAADSADECAVRYLAATLENLAAASRLISPAKAREAHVESLRLQSELLAAHPERNDYRQELAIGYDSFGVFLADSRDQREAAKAFSRAASIQIELLQTSPNSPVLLRQLAWSNNRLGQSFARQGDIPAAIDALRHSLEAQQQVCDVSGNDRRDVWTLGGIWNNLGFASEGSNDFVVAEDAYRLAVEKLDAAFDETTASESQRITLDRTYVNLTRMLKRKGDMSEALTVLNRRSTLWQNDPLRLKLVEQEAATLEGNFDSRL